MRAIRLPSPLAKQANPNGNGHRSHFSARIASDRESFCRRTPVIAAAATHRFLSEGEHVFTQGEPLNDIVLALSGRIKLSRTSLTGASVILRVVNPGDIFDLRRGMRPQLHTVTASALRSSSIAIWPMRSWQRLVGEMPGLALGLVHIAGHALVENSGAVRGDRYPRRAQAHRPCRPASHRPSRQGGGGGIRIDFPVSQQDLASLTGTTLHAVSRILTRWERHGLISGWRRTLLVRDLSGLMHLATAAET